MFRGTLGWEGFGCQVHRLRTTGSSSVDQGRAGLAWPVERPSLLGSGERAGAVREPARLSQRPPVVNAPSVARGIPSVQANSGKPVTSGMWRHIWRYGRSERADEGFEQRVEHLGLLKAGQMGGICDDNATLIADPLRESICSFHDVGQVVLADNDE